jgi:hypothetical protein
MARKQTYLPVGAIICLIAALMSLPGFARETEDATQKVKASMALLKSEASKLGPPRIEGTDRIAGQEVPILYFGGARVNGAFDLVDRVAKKAGGTATVFVRSGENFVRISTNVKKDDGSRAVGTFLDPNGKVIFNIRNDEPFYGDAIILGKDYTTGYEPIRDASNNLIGIYYVGYLK